MTLSLEHCDAEALRRCGWTTRGAAQGHDTLESSARALVRCFHDDLQADGPQGPERACALVRCYKTHPFGSLPEALQRAAVRLLEPGQRATPGLRCATLLASAGDEPAWNSRHVSGGHVAIPLPTPESVARWPMIASLARGFGLQPVDLVERSRRAVRPRRGRNYGVFHVADVRDGAVAPTQGRLVRLHGVRSIVGFGGALSTGELFAVVLFCRVPVSPAVAEQFRALALHVKSALFAFGEHDVFDPFPLVRAREAVS